jgi:hypothetical protein
VCDCSECEIRYCITSTPFKNFSDEYTDGFDATTDEGQKEGDKEYFEVDDGSDRIEFEFVE